ncbi:MAG: DUF362 domain-containing protein [Planctomycetota bacterium]|jgi:hypothetical protein
MRSGAVRRSTCRCLTRPSAALLAAATIVALGGSGSQDPPHHAPGGTEDQCPGRALRDAKHDPHAADAHHAGSPVHLPAALVPRSMRLRVPSYGIVWGFPDPPEWAVIEPLVDPEYRAAVFHAVDCPAPDGDRFPGLDALIGLMDHEGLSLYESANGWPESGPDGLIAADDVVIIKINYQWPERGGTNVDLLRGLIRRIVDHPDGFAGEVVVCENTQFASIAGFDRASNNAEDPGLSPHDVIVEFQAQGFDVSHSSWTALRFNEVAEYDQSDTTDGYVVGPFDARFNGRVSYPKFQSASGTWISVKRGIWDPESAMYDGNRLAFINVPVLKSHHAVYGVTACIKNYMGVVTGGLGTNSHNAIAWGLLGEVLAEIGLADLNILDCIWINANPLSGPSTPESIASRRDELVASVDPVAADIWATTNILIPGFLANGFEPPWPGPSADPDDPESAFRHYLDHSMSFILLAGNDVTNDLQRIDARTVSAGGDLDGDGVPDESDNCAYDENSDQADCDEDGVGDVCAIREGLSTDLNGNGVPDECECLADIDGSGAVGVGDLIELLLTWGPGPPRPADLDADGVVDVDDLVALLIAWGPCS